MGARDAAGAIRPSAHLTAAGRAAAALVVAVLVHLAPAGAAPLRAQAAPRRDTLRIVHVGDINLARTVGRRILRGEGDSVFRDMRAALQAADVAIGNLESVLVDRGDTTDAANAMTFSGPKQGAALLRDAGFTMVTTANNHAWDRGQRGLLQSLAHLDSAGVRHAGTGTTREEAWRPAIIRRGGWTIAVVSMTRVFNGPGMNLAGTGPACCIAWADSLRFRDAARWARDSAGADVVLASVHGGVEYRATPRPQDAAFLRALVRAGADAVIGHHPQVPQGIEWVEGKPILHSLGNFVFLQSSAWTRRGLWAELVVAPDRAITVRVRPVQATLRPRFATGRDSAAVMTHVDSLSRRLGRRAVEPARTRARTGSDVTPRRGPPRDSVRRDPLRR